jgi:5-methylcytosine-specific restriction endonuclease McrA
MDRNKEIIDKYVSGSSAAELSTLYNVSVRQIQRIVKKANKQRTISESFRLAIATGRMKYYKKPEHLKAKRKTLTLKTRHTVLNRDDYTCQSCGNTVKQGVRIEIDHIDNDATNNSLDNLQVLCNLCNQGKSYDLRTIA